MPEDFDLGPSVLAPGAPKHTDRLARLLVWPLLALLMTATVVFYILYSPLTVVGDSMYPSLNDGERLLRTKDYTRAHRGDIVIIDTESSSDRDDIVKRVIAVAGDTVEVRDDIALVNGRAESVDELTVLFGHGFYVKPTVVPAGYVYVMGDNRPVSLDSRMTGPVPVGKIRGKAVFVFAPFYAVRAL